MEATLERMERTSVVSRLASGLAHDFNNLLAVIQSSAEVARRASDGSGAVEAAVDRIEAAVQRGSEKVRQIQQMAGQTAPSQEFRPLHINPVVEEVLELTRARWQDEAESKGVRYDVQWHPGSPPAVVGSPSDLRAALVALVFNAVEAMPDGGTLDLRTAETSTGEVMVTVRDTGHGILEEHLAQLTDALFTTRRDRQMGLGLHLVQSVLEQHGGRLEVDSRKGEGATFAIIIPAAEEPPSEPAPRPRLDLLDRPQATVPEVHHIPTRHGRSVLLIDDQLDLLQVVRTILEGQGYDVDTATNGRDGVAAALAQRYSVILTDLGMPDISGWEVASQIRASYPNVPIILMTGWAADISPDRLEENEIQALLPKPFRSERLLAVIQDVLKK
jgi:CheY-like chemotaxis protein